MNIARYISLYLLEHHSCCIKGVGTIHLKQIPAYYDGSSLHPAKKELSFTESEVPDQLIEYIATYEEGDVAIVGLAVQEYAMWASTELQLGREVTIPYIGKLYRHKNNTQFSADAAFLRQPSALVITKITRDAMATIGLNEDGSKKQGSAMTIVWVVLLLLVLGGIGAYCYEMYTELDSFVNFIHVDAKDIVTPAPVDVTPMPPTSADTARKDTTNNTIAAPNANTQTPVADNKPHVYRYQVVLTSYYALDKAQRSLEAIQTRGNNVHIETKDSTKFMIVMQVRTTRRDTTKVLDSLAALFNPKGVYLR